MPRGKIYFIGVILVVFSTLVFYKYQLNQENQAPLILDYAKTMVAECKSQPDWRRCYGEKLASYNKNHQFAAALKILNSLEDLDQKTRDCHLLAHNLATAEVSKDPLKWLDIFDLVDQTTCTNGFVHGVLEGRSRFEANFAVNAEVIPQICEQIEGKTAQRTQISVDDACAHVLGHIMLAENDGDIEKSVGECQKLKERSYQVSCLNGTFMENITRDNLMIHTQVPSLPMTQQSADQLDSYCRKFSDKVREACFRELAHLYTAIEKNDPLKVYEACHRAETEIEGNECYFHAINLMVLGPKFDTQKLANLCINYANENMLKICIARTIYPLIISSVKFTDRAINFCLLIKDNMQSFCFAKIGENLKKIVGDSQKRLDLCLPKTPEQYLNSCAGS